MIIVWILVVVLLIMSIILCMGKGGFLIAGYNTASKEEKAKYDEKKLSRVFGVGMLLVTLLLIVMACFPMMDYVGFVIGAVLLIAIGMVIIGNTMCKNKDYVAGTTTITKKKMDNKTKIIVGVSTLVLCAGMIWMLFFVGTIQVVVNKDSATIEISVWEDETFAYQDIETLTYTDSFDVGKRAGGFGSFHVLAGDFKNDAFGKYKLYAYKNCREYVVISTKQGKIVCNKETPELTKEIYQKLKEAIKR
ncbi:MAG: DUF3784 domain-containing protein [Longicatena sp.]